jgi:hypothetical protein
MNTILTSEYYSTGDSGLVGYWRLDEGTGQSAEDLSVFSNTATLGSTPTSDANDPAWVSANILIVNVEDDNNNDFIPNEFSLSQNYPNPFNPSTVISYQLPVTSNVTFKVYDILGNEIATLVNEEKPAGSYKVNFNASGLSSGIYFYQLKTDSFIETRKMILIK